MTIAAPRSLRLLGLALLLAGSGTPPLRAASRAEILDRAVRVSDRLARIRRLDRGWEDGPYLVGSLLVWEELQRDSPGVAMQLRDRVIEVVGDGTSPIFHGDSCGYAQAALDLLRLASPLDARRATFLRATSGPLEFARLAMRYDASSGPPLPSWWVDGGYGTRYWQDDFYTLVPWLAMRGSSLDGLPADGLARNLAYEWIEAYAYDHRKSLSGAADRAVPALFDRRGPLLLDEGSGLFWHDVGRIGQRDFWGRGNGWVAFALARAQRFLDRPYDGGRFRSVLDAAAVRGLLSRMASTLAGERNTFGTWNADILRRDLFPVPESSGSALFTFMLGTGIDEGWLDRTAYTPIVLEAFQTLLLNLDDEGDLHNIQRTGTGPDSTFLTSDDPSSNSDFGVGAFLLAAAAVSRLPESDLARLGSVNQVILDRGRSTTATDGRLSIAAAALGRFGTEAVQAHALGAISEQRYLAAEYSREDATVRVENGGTGDVALFLESPCGGGPADTLRLSRGRIQACVTFRNRYTGETGVARALPQADAFGYFTFFDAGNPEVFVKALDFGAQRPYLVFYGGLTDFEYTVRVVDDETGQSLAFTKPAGSFGGGADNVTLLHAPAAGTGRAPESEELLAADATSLDLSRGEVRVTVSWRDPYSGLRGNAFALPQQDHFGFFYFADRNNPEVFVKVLDFGADRPYLVFYAGLTDFEYTVTYSVLRTGQTISFTKPAGTFAGGADGATLLH